MHYGGDYNPEQWTPDVWRDDIMRMREARVTLVTVGVFAWARIQPAEGEFDWDWLDEVLDLLHGAGIGVDLATATASPPPWAVSSYPEMLPKTVDGVVYGAGSRQHYAPTSPHYRRLAAELVTQLAARYARHPAVQMWHVNNELGCHVHADYSDNADVGFRRWLERKYETVEALNASWGSAFWSQLYRSFDHVPLPRRAPYINNPAAELDFRRFTSDALLELYVMERDIIRASGALQPITTNLMGAFPAADYWAWAAEMDLVSDDSYPDPNDPESWREAAFTRDLMRSLKPGVPWLVMEQATEAVNSRATNAPKAPGQMAALSMQSVGRGADGVLFFQWRQSRRGAERFHSAMLPHAGTDTRVWHEVTSLGDTLQRFPSLPAGPSGAKVALIFRWDSWWALQSPDLPTVVDYERHVRQWHAAAQKLHLAVDIVRGDEDLADYDLVLAPSLFLIDDATADALHTYANGGGTVVVTAFSDVVDAESAFREGGFTAALRELVGVQVHEFGALVPSGAHGPGQDSAHVETPFGILRGHTAAETLAVHDAIVIGRFSGGRNEGAPAFTVRQCGAGRGYYLATLPTDAAALELMRYLSAELGLEPLLDPAGTEDLDVSRRGDHLMIINMGAADADLPVSGRDLLTGEAVTSTRLKPHQWLVVQQEAHQ